MMGGFPIMHPCYNPPLKIPLKKKTFQIYLDGTASFTYKTTSRIFNSQQEFLFTPEKYFHP